MSITIQNAAIYIFNMIEHWSVNHEIKIHNKIFTFKFHTDKIINTLHQYTDQKERRNKLYVLFILELQTIIQNNQKHQIKIFDSNLLSEKRHKHLKIILKSLEKIIKMSPNWDMYLFTKNFFLNYNDQFTNILAKYFESLIQDPLTSKIFETMTEFEKNIIRLFSKSIPSTKQFQTFMIKSAIEIFNFQVFGRSALPDVLTTRLELTNCIDHKMQQQIDENTCSYTHNVHIKELMDNSQLNEIKKSLSSFFYVVSDNLETNDTQLDSPMKSRDITYTIDSLWNISDSMKFKIKYIPGNLFKDYYLDYEEFSLVKTVNETYKIHPYICEIFPDSTIEHIFDNLKNGVLTLMQYDFRDQELIQEIDFSKNTFTLDNLAENLIDNHNLQIHNLNNMERHSLRCNALNMLKDEIKIIKDYQNIISHYPHIIGNPMLFRYACWYTRDSLFQQLIGVVNIPDLCDIIDSYVGSIGSSERCVRCRGSCLSYTNKMKFMIRWRNEKLYHLDCLRRHFC